MECAQLRITGGGSTTPNTVSFPGAYSGMYTLNNLRADLTHSRALGSDPGIKINIYQSLTGYTIPGTRLACRFTSLETEVRSLGPAVFSCSGGGSAPDSPSTTAQTTPVPSPTTAPSGTVAQWGQCGGIK